MKLDGIRKKDLHDAELGDVGDEGVDVGVPEVVAKDHQGLLDAPHLRHPLHQVAEVLQPIVHLWGEG